MQELLKNEFEHFCKLKKDQGKAQQKCDEKKKSMTENQGALKDLKTKIIEEEKKVRELQQLEKEFNHKEIEIQYKKEALFSILQQLSIKDH